MPTRLFTDGGGELYDADGKPIAAIGEVQMLETSTAEAAEENAKYATLPIEETFSASFDIVITKKNKKFFKKQRNVFMRHIRRMKRKKEQKRREMLKTFGTERYHVMMRALRNVETYWKELHEDMIPIGYDDGNFHITMYTDEGGISVNITEKYQGPVEAKFVTV